jgi:hypothetical protein
MNRKARGSNVAWRYTGLESFLTNPKYPAVVNSRHCPYHDHGAKKNLRRNGIPNSVIP